MKRILLRISILALTTSTLSSYAAMEVLFSPNGGVNARISKELKRTQSTLDIAMYSFSDTSLLNEVKDLATSGVRVRLILNKAHQQEAKSMELEQAGVDIRYVNIVMHHKFAIVDGPQSSRADASHSTLMTGSQNWSRTSDNSYDEDFIIFKNEAQMIRLFQNEFQHLWKHSRDFEGPASIETTSQSFYAPRMRDGAMALFTSANFQPREWRGEWVFSTAVSLDEGVAGRETIKAIDSASRSIKVAHSYFRRADIYNALKRAMKRGVRVQMILDGKNYSQYEAYPPPPGDTKGLDEALAKDGADIRYKLYSRYWSYPTAKQMHSKYMIVDDRLVLTGSLNWSENSELETIENVIVFDKSEGDVSAYIQNFEKVFNYGDGQFTQLLQEINGQRGYGPCHFGPISLAPAQINKLRGSYARGACR